MNLRIGTAGDLAALRVHRARIVDSCVYLHRVLGSTAKDVSGTAATYIDGVVAICSFRNRPFLMITRGDLDRTLDTSCFVSVQVVCFRMMQTLSRLLFVGPRTV